MSHDIKQPEGVKPTAVLVSVQLSQVSDEDFQSSLAELGRLVHTLGFEVLATITQKRKAPATGTVVGEGKLKELARWTGGSGVVASLAPKAGKKNFADAEDDSDEDEISDEELFASIAADGDIFVKPERRADKVVFDTELSPSQIRNLESATDAEVMDRTGVIVEIFHRHAKTREARLQVEIARLRYLAPRLRATRTGERQGGGIGAKGVGETAHELDSRRIRDRIAELQRELEAISEDASVRRSRRSDQARVALVGYTNAGKSSLMRALTGSDVLVEDKLFATLDTTMRVLQPEGVPKILVSDTVGFIKKLPHDLVASFRSTLDEAGDASLQLHVVDGSDPSFRSQLEVTRTVLKEIGAEPVDSLLVLNKMDQVDPAVRQALRIEFPQAVQISTRDPKDIERVKNLLKTFFERGMLEETLVIPYAQGQLVGEVHRSMRVLGETHEESGTHLKVKASKADLERIRKQLKP